MGHRASLDMVRGHQDGGTRLGSRLQEFVAVETLAAYRKECLSRRDRARINAYAANGDVAVRLDEPTSGRDLLDRPGGPKVHGCPRRSLVH